MKAVSSFIVSLFGIIVIIVSLLGLAMTKGLFTERLKQFPGDPTVYFIILIVIGVLAIIISSSSKKYIG
ncbi:MAG: hypothetical protein QXP53_00310 [Candidatus Pacearchaeota archaeon]